MDQTTLDQAQVKDLVDKLDKLVPSEGARVVLRQYGGGPDESEMQGNAAGYLRLGIEILKGVLAGSNPKTPGFIDIKLGHLISEGSDVHFDNFELTDDPKGTKYSPASKLLTILVFAVVLLFFISAIVGFVFIVRFLTSINFK